MKIHLLFFILCLLTLKSIAADNKKQEIDSIVSKAKELQSQGQFLPQLETAIKALKLSDTYNYDEGKARAHFSMADALVYVGLYKEALQHLEAVEQTNYYKEKIIMQSEVHRVRGRAYTYLKLNQQAIREYYLQLGVIKNLEGDAQKISYLYTYANLCTVFDRLVQLDSVQKYIELQLRVLQGGDEKNYALMYLGLYDDLGQLYVRKGDFGRAQKYLDKSLELVDKYKIPQYSNTYLFLANLEIEKGNYKQALAFYEKSLAHKRALGDRNGVKDSYRHLADFYRKTKLDQAKVNEYERAFSRLNDSLEKENKQVIHLALNLILKSKDKETATKVSKSVTITVVILLVLIVVITFFIWRVRHNRRLLGQKEGELHETESLNRELIEQIGENKFNNLIDLAKSNNPEFLILFTELYPQFIQSLKTLDPNIRTTEMEFCAMAFLNFSTKNIAEYTYVTVRAVQVRKNRLRKKFNIPSEVDFNTWMHGLSEHCQVEI